jgi:hypothetical protein
VQRLGPKPACAPARLWRADSARPAVKFLWERCEYSFTELSRQGRDMRFFAFLGYTVENPLQDWERGRFGVFETQFYYSSAACGRNQA